jgi:hypothetical protein
MAREALKLPGLGATARDNNWPPFLKEVATHCRDQIAAMLHIHNSLYGAGTGQEFFSHRYMADLPRAIRARIQPEIEKRIAAANKAGKIELHKAQIEKIEPRKPQIEKNEAQKPQIDESVTASIKPSENSKTLALDDARGEMLVSRGKLYDCTDKNLPEVLKAASGAQVLPLVMARCRRDFETAFQSVLEIFRIDAGLDKVDDIQKSLLRDEIERVVSDHIVAAAAAAATRRQ